MQPASTWQAAVAMQPALLTHPGAIGQNCRKRLCTSAWGSLPGQPEQEQATCMPQEADSSRRTSQVGLVRRLPCTTVSQCNLSMLQQSYMECATGSVPCSAQAGRAYLHICSNATELRDDFLAQPLAHNTIASGSLRAGSCIGGRRLVVFAAMAGMCWLPAWRAQNASRVLGNAAPQVPAE